MAVPWVDFEDDDTVTAAVRWPKTPELSYSLKLSPTGRLIAFTVEADEGYSVSATRLRLVPLGEMHAAARAEVIEIARSWTDPKPGRITPRAATAADRRRWEKHLDELREVARRFEAGGGDKYLASVAAMYADLIAQRVRNPYERLCAELGIKKKRAQNLVYQARERGLLTSEGQGKAGGALTDLANEILTSTKER